MSDDELLHGSTHPTGNEVTEPAPGPPPFEPFAVEEQPETLWDEIKDMLGFWKP